MFPGGLPTSRKEEQGDENGHLPGVSSPLSPCPHRALPLSGDMKLLVGCVSGPHIPEPGFLQGARAGGGWVACSRRGAATEPRCAGLASPTAGYHGLSLCPFFVGPEVQSNLETPYSSKAPLTTPQSSLFGEGEPL